MREQVMGNSIGYGCNRKQRNFFRVTHLLRNMVPVVQGELEVMVVAMVVLGVIPVAMEVMGGTVVVVELILRGSADIEALNPQVFALTYHTSYCTLRSPPIFHPHPEVPPQPFNS